MTLTCENMVFDTICHERDHDRVGLYITWNKYRLRIE